MAILDLSKLDWMLCGHRPNLWYYTMKEKRALAGQWGPVKASLPGSVQRALLEAGMIEDWLVGFNSLKCEWVENRHWEFTATIPAGAVPAGERVLLDAQGLDYSGWILVDCVEAATFRGALVPHVIDLTGQLGDGLEHKLSIIFDLPPNEQGQFGWSSRTKYFKPRYNFSWDWCPRFVPIGVWDDLTLRTGVTAAVSVASVRPALAQDNRTGSVEAVVDFAADAAPAGGVKEFTAVLFDGARELARVTVPAGDGPNKLVLAGVAVEPWWCNLEGGQKMYRLALSAAGAGGKTTWSKDVSIGFKRIEWRPCEGQPVGAEDWLCVINGRPVFLQGVNWTPVRLAYPDTTDEEYRRLIYIYRDMGCNLLRVWGGGILEKEVFYRLCDEAGIMVWQEFPFSSSGVDNYPTDDPAALDDLRTICETYIRRRAHHVSLLLWCGGNELHEGKIGLGKPCGYSYLAIALMRDMVAAHDPGRRFLATSSSGPSFLGEDNFGKGLHHDVHGPWTMPKGMEEWKQFWTNDDALFRSETGEAGATSLEILKKYSGGLHLTPNNHGFWKHLSTWWGRWRRTGAGMPDQFANEAELGKFIDMTRQMQAEALEASTGICKSRFPRSSGILLWVGHDCGPCPANASVVEFEQRPKPCVEAIKRVFRARPGKA
jgi:beta-mannosidase